jgi:hypothetical protein
VLLLTDETPLPDVDVAVLTAVLDPDVEVAVLTAVLEPEVPEVRDSAGSNVQR